MKAGHLLRDEVKPDLKVIYLAAAGFDLQVGSVPFGYSISEPYNGLVHTGSAISTVTTGTLVIDLLDKTDRTIFRGTAKAVFERTPSGNAAADAKGVSKQVNKGIAKIFKKYPTARK